MPQQQSQNYWIELYIQQNYPQYSRYQIDRFLLETGANPTELEVIWETLLSKPLPATPASIRHKIRKFFQLGSAYVLIASIILLLLSLFYLFKFFDNYWLLVLPGNTGLAFAMVSFFGLLACLVWAAPKPLSKIMKRAMWILGCASLLFLLSALNSDDEHLDTLSFNGHKYHLSYHTGWNEFTSFKTLELFNCDTSGFFCKDIAGVSVRKLNLEGDVRKSRLLSDPGTGKLSILLNGKIVHTFETR